ncbi:transcription factor E2F6 [Nematostella vectensis]|uniref:transcription factor E2F6 n=1 Tax=Nematostella vectensis TaxID=45351 RepID=UPI00138FFA72|nr:transcription factor E2F6 [Nematostella vectensis]
MDYIRPSVITSGMAHHPEKEATTLATLTKEFVSLLKASPKRTISVEKAVERLHANKRRVYDIVNILEGAGVVKRTLDKEITWSGGDSNESASSQTISKCSEKLRRDLAEMDAQERVLDDLLENAKEELRRTTRAPENERHAFVTMADIEGIESLGEQTIVAIRAPPATELDIPWPEERIQMKLKSSRGPVQVDWLRLNERGSIRVSDTPGACALAHKSTYGPHTSTGNE